MYVVRPLRDGHKGVQQRIHILVKNTNDIIMQSLAEAGAAVVSRNHFGREDWKWFCGFRSYGETYCLC